MGNCCCGSDQRPPNIPPMPEISINYSLNPQSSLSSNTSTSKSLKKQYSPGWPNKGEIIVGLRNFEASYLKDLSFQKGDRMKVLAVLDETWIYVKHMTTKNCGLVPEDLVAPELSLESYDWFFANTSRREAERLLLGDENQPIGTFLIRPAEYSVTRYSLSIKDFEPLRGNHVKHYRIQFTDNKKFYISTTKTFKTLPELVLAYSENRYTLCYRLLTPCKKPEPTIIDLSSDYRDKWEIERKEIRLEKKLNEGHFGEVFLGKWRNQHTVAVKILKTSKESAPEFLKETAIMKRFRHKSLVQLYGVCSISQPLYIVQEYMEKGDLKNYLKRDQGKTLKFKDLIFIAFQVASGMEHLELLNFIHRDLAARNVLLGPNNEAKICDFGLARIIDNKYCTVGGCLPAKWTAPEGLKKEKIFTIKSDVWSYGVLLMELFTYGQDPFSGLKPLIAIELVLDGYRMPKPSTLPKEIYDIMFRCWDDNPEQRPTFKYLANYFEYMEVSYKGTGERSKMIIKHVKPRYEDHEKNFTENI